MTSTPTAKLPQLAALYAQGQLTWREIADETGVSYGDLLLELARQGLQLPRVKPSRSQRQDRLWEAILQRAADSK